MCNYLVLSELGGGNFIFVNPNDPNSTITVLHPDADRDAFLKRIRKSTLLNGEATLEILGFGFRVKEKGYFTFGITEHLDMDKEEYQAVEYLYKEMRGETSMSDDVTLDGLD